MKSFEDYIREIDKMWKSLAEKHGIKYFHLPPLVRTREIRALSLYLPSLNPEKFIRNNKKNAILAVAIISYLNCSETFILLYDSHEKKIYWKQYAINNKTISSLLSALNTLF